MVTILFPSSYFQKDQVDPDLEKEAKVAANTPGLQIALFDYEAWALNQQLLLTKKPLDPSELTLYRGWMLKPEDYSLLYDALEKEKLHLLTNPQEYRQLHLFPEIYPLIKKDTAPTLILKPGEKVDIKQILRRFPRFIVKDDVKAMRGSRFPAYFDKNITQEQLDSYLNIFFKIRGDYLTGGLCIKEYFDLREDSRGKTNEYRAFYLKGKLLSLSADQAQELPESLPPEELLLEYAHLPSPFYSLDLAELKQGGWKILETGDGQVSRLSPDQSVEGFYEELVRNL